MTLSPPPPTTRRRRLIRIAAVAALAVLVLAAIGWRRYLSPQPLLPEAGPALANADSVTVTRDGGYLTFAPTGRTPTTGLIIYPGGRVPPAAYARTAREIAEAGYLVVIVPMPLNLAILGVARADEVRADHPEIERWVLAGHSLGGAMACRYAADNPGEVTGLALWAAYCVDDISHQGLAAASLYGSLDAGAARMSSAASRALLPADARIQEIAGGNHGQMGDYSGQPDDPPATLPRDEQRAAVVAATVALLGQMDSR